VVRPDDITAGSHFIFQFETLSPTAVQVTWQSVDGTDRAVIVRLYDENKKLLDQVAVASGKKTAQFVVQESEGALMFASVQSVDSLGQNQGHPSALVKHQMASWLLPEAAPPAPHVEQQHFGLVLVRSIPVPNMRSGPVAGGGYLLHIQKSDNQPVPDAPNVSDTHLVLKHSRSSVALLLPRAGLAFH
jgi:hypothetical protein